MSYLLRGYLSEGHSPIGKEIMTEILLEFDNVSPALDLALHFIKTKAFDYVFVSNRFGQQVAIVCDDSRIITLGKENE